MSAPEELPVNTHGVAREAPRAHLAATSTAEATVIGAGPYGLAVSAFLRGQGVQTRVLGEPMAFWKLAMPVGMFIRSPWQASTIGDPRDDFTLDRFVAETGAKIQRPIPLDDFMRYTTWFTERTLPDPDPRRVSTLERQGDGFRLVLDDGEILTSRRVVVAAGLEALANVPEGLADVTSERVFHAARGIDIPAYGGRRVLVVGGGQTAVETATLLAEAGAEVELILRAQSIHWLGRSARLHSSVLRKVLYAPSDIGPAGISWLVHFPGIFRRFPRAKQETLGKRALRPAASAWLYERSAPVQITPNRSVAGVDETADALRVTLDDGSTRDVDHVIFGTGYRADVRRYSFISDSVLDGLSLAGGLPRLNSQFESTVPGLYFVGAPATYSFGPLMRFVAGTGWAARAVARAFR